MLAFFNKAIARMDQNKSPLGNDINPPFPVKGAAIVLIFFFLIIATSGCSTLGWMVPTDFSYTYATDQSFKPAGHWFGFSWPIRK